MIVINDDLWEMIDDLKEDELKMLMTCLSEKARGEDTFCSNRFVRIVYNRIVADSARGVNDRISRARSEAGKRGASARWDAENGKTDGKIDGKKMANEWQNMANNGKNGKISEQERESRESEERKENGEERSKEEGKERVEGKESKDKEQDTIVILNSGVGGEERSVPSPISKDNGTDRKKTAPLPKEKPPDPKQGSPLFRSPLVREAWEEYRQMRIRIRKPFTGMAETRRVYDLEQLSQGNTALAVKILNQSVDNCWVGLFALKEEPKSKADRYREEWENA